MQLTYDENMDIFDIKFFPSQRTSYTLPLGIYEIANINKTFECSLPDIVKVGVTTDDIRLKSNLYNNQTPVFTKKPLFSAVLGFAQSHSGPVGHIEGFIHLITGSYKNHKPNINTGIDKVDLKCDCFNNNNVNGVPERFLYKFAPFSTYMS